MHWTTTTILLDQLADFQDDAWRQFTDRFWAPVTAFARKLGLSEDEAQDAAQQTLAAFAQRFREGRYDRTKGRLSSWLFGIAYREAMEVRRRAAKRPGQAPDTPGRTTFFAGLPDEDAARASWDIAWERHIAKQCLEVVQREVDPKTFQAFEMVALREQTPADVAVELGMTRNAVFIAKHRVLKRLGEVQKQFEGAA